MFVYWLQSVRYTKRQATIVGLAVSLAAGRADGNIFGSSVGVDDGFIDGVSDSWVVFKFVGRAEGHIVGTHDGSLTCVG